MKTCECWQWDCSFPAVSSSVEPMARALRAYLTGCCSPCFRFKVELLLREALTNAIEHGCGGNPELRVRCVARRRPSRLLLAVLDEGPGFDWRRHQQRELLLESTRGRGLPILRQYADAVRFNTAGNGVVLIKREESCQVLLSRRSWERCKPVLSVWKTK